MTPLRQRMIEDMRLRNLAPATQRNYLHYVTEFAEYFNLSPEKLDAEAIHQFLVHQVEERKLTPETVNQSISALKFLYQTTLECLDRRVFSARQTILQAARGLELAQQPA